MQDENLMWKRLDEHNSKLNDLYTQQEVSRAEVRALERRLDRQMTEFGTALARIEHKIDANTAYQEQTKGAHKMGAWFTGIGIAIAGVVVAAWNALFGGN